MIEHVPTTSKPMPKAQRLAKINKERRCLMKLLAKLRKDINALLVDKAKNHPVLEILFKRRKNYRKRLTKLTRKRHVVKQ